MYIILRKVQYSAKEECDTDMKANEAYESKEIALEKITALNVLNDEKHVSYVIGTIKE